MDVAGSLVDSLFNHIVYKTDNGGIVNHKGQFFDIEFIFRLGLLNNPFHGFPHGVILADDLVQFRLGSDDGNNLTTGSHGNIVDGNNIFGVSHGDGKAITHFFHRHRLVPLD